MGRIPCAPLAITLTLGCAGALLSEGEDAFPVCGSLLGESHRRLEETQTAVQRLRLRCGDHRIFFDQKDENTIRVSAVRHRREAFRERTTPIFNQIFSLVGTTGSGEGAWSGTRVLERARFVRRTQKRRGLTRPPRSVHPSWKKSGSPRPAGLLAKSAGYAQ